MAIKVTAYDRRNGGLKPISAEIHLPSNNPSDIRRTAITALYDQMAAGREAINLVGIQFWNMGGITWYLIQDEPYCGELTQKELFSL